MTAARSLRSLAGVVVKDLPLYLSALAGQGNAYLGLRNRAEQIEWSPDREGVRCDWQWTSDLHAARQIPWLGSRLARLAHAQHPVRRLPQPDVSGLAPAISFIIGHRGMARLPHLLATLESIAGQEGVAVECLVVEQDGEARLVGSLPSWVRHVHTPPPALDMPYCRSWTFNIGVKCARAGIVVLHDNDMMVPADYAANIVRLVQLGHDVVNLKRFIFYMSQAHSAGYFASTIGLLDHAPGAVTQNLEGGGSVAITREAYERIGGMDESFVGWGGEDNEFWERAQTLRVWPFAFLPIWHLWHAAQAGKQAAQSETVPRYLQLSVLPVDARIAALKECSSGQLFGPAGMRLDTRKAP